MDDGMQQQRYPLSFTGSGGQFFKIWIVNILLTIVTLYIYSAWAKVRTKRYFHGNTVLDGSSFEYHAKPLQILLSRLVAAVLFIIITFGGSFHAGVPVVAGFILFLIIPWAIWRSTKFNMRMTSFRNIRFGFDGALWPLYLYQFLLPLGVYGVGALGFYIGKSMGVGANLESLWFVGGWVLLVLVLNLLVTAFTHKHLSSYFLNHYLYGKSRFSGQLSLGRFFKAYILATLLALGTLLALVAVVVFTSLPENTSVLAWFENMSDLQNYGGSEEEQSQAIAGLLFKLMLVFYAYLFIVGYYVVAIVQAQVRNHVFAQAVLDQRVAFESTVSVNSLWWVSISNLLLVIVTLGLARPFTQVRMAKYLANRTTTLSATSLDDFVGEKRQEISAFGEELGDVFDMDMDVGF